MLGLLLACGVLPDAAPTPLPVDDPPRLAAPGFDCAAVDHDGDGANACEDCDDTDPSTWPGAPAVCFDGRNNSCGVNDETPCTLEGTFRVNEVGARVMGPNTAGVDIEQLWGRGAALIDLAGTSALSSDVFYSPLHSGRVTDQKSSGFPTGSGSDWRHTNAGDVTGDGLSDVLFEVDGWTTHVRPDPLDPASDIVLDVPSVYIFGPSGDFDGDGIQDVAVANDLTGRLTVFGGLSPGETVPLETAVTDIQFHGMNPYSFWFNTTADVNGDGLTDVGMIVAPYEDPYRYGGLAGVYLSPHPPLRERTSTAEWLDFLDAGVRTWNTQVVTPVMADVDDDGRPELLVQASLEEEGAGTGLVVVPFGPTGDLDGDNLRLAWRDTSITSLELVDDVDDDGRSDLLLTHIGPDRYWGASVYPLPGALVDYRDDLVHFSYQGEPVFFTHWPEVADGNNDGVQDFLFHYSDGGVAEEAEFFVLYLGGL